MSIKIKHYPKMRICKEFCEIIDFLKVYAA